MAYQEGGIEHKTKLEGSFEENQVIYGHLIFRKRVSGGHTILIIGTIKSINKNFEVETVLVENDLNDGSLGQLPVTVNLSNFRYYRIKCLYEFKG